MRTHQDYQRLLDAAEQARRLSRLQQDHPLTRQLTAKIQGYRRKVRETATPTDVTLTGWRQVLRRFQHSCAYCGRSDVHLGQDHFIPLSQGGEHVLANLVPACKRCNGLKGKAFWPVANLQPLSGVTLLLRAHIKRTLGRDLLRNREWERIR